MSMRDMFPGHYRPTDVDFQRMWREGLFVFDANMLLNIYRFSPKTRNAFFEYLDALKPRVWIPHQAALEFQNNRVGVILDQVHMSERLAEEVDKVLTTLSKELERLNRHPFVDCRQLQGMILRTKRRLQKALRSERDSYPTLVDEDPLRDHLDQIFSSRIGSPYELNEIENLRRAGDDRFKRLVPPGYMDAGKKEDGKESANRYGDYVLWRQILDHAKVEKKPILLMTDDRKEDWWLRKSGRTIGPRPELVEEMRAEAEVAFYMYPSDRFLDEASTYLQLQRQEAAIREARELRLQEEERKSAQGRRHRGVTISQLQEAARRQQEHGDLRITMPAIALSSAGLHSLQNTVAALNSIQSTTQVWQSLLGSLTALNYGANTAATLRDFLGGIDLSPRIPELYSALYGDVLSARGSEEESELADEEADDEHDNDENGDEDTWVAMDSENEQDKADQEREGDEE